MSRFLKNSYKHCESTVSQSGSSMHFWGICCESGKQYAQVVGQRFRITMAVLDPKSFCSDASDKTVSLLVMRGGIEYLLCVLKYDEIPQVSLNLIFDKGENVKFYINGYGKVYLSGYQLTDSEGDVLNDENGYLCPLVEVKTRNKKAKVEKVSMSPVRAESEIATTKRKAKAKANKVISEGYQDDIRKDEASFWLRYGIDDQSDESDDDDFSITNETESDEDETSEEDDIEEEETTEEDSIKEDESSEEDNIEEEELDEDDSEIILNSHGSQKRRKQEQALPQKRSKKSSSNLDESSESICIEDNDSVSTEDIGSGNMNSSAGNTPMQKRQVFEAAAVKKKKSKKKKRLSEISNISEKSMNNQNQDQQLETPNAKSTPNDKQGKKPIQKLEGGVEVQDVIVGKGPAVTKGKIVHVFYVARLQDNKIFDSRLPPKKPFSFKIGAGEVIKGWDVGLLGMRVGGKRKLRVPPHMAYKGRNIPGIPPDSTVSFVVELQAIS